MMSRYTLLVTPDVESSDYSVKVPALPGCVTDDQTVEDALHRAEDASALYLEDEEDGRVDRATGPEVIVATVEVAL